MCLRSGRDPTTKKISAEERDIYIKGLDANAPQLKKGVKQAVKLEGLLLDCFDEVSQPALLLAACVM